MVKFLLGVVSGGLLVTGGLVVSSMLFPTQHANDNAGVTPATEQSISAPAPAAADAGKPVAAEPAATESATPPTAEDKDETAVAAAEPAEAKPAEADPAAAEPAPAEPAATDPASVAPATETAAAEPAATDGATEAEAAPAETAVATPEAADKTTAAETGSSETAAPAAAPDTGAAPAAEAAAETAAPAPEAEKPVVADALPAPDAPQAETAMADAGAPAATEVTVPTTAAEPSKPAETVADAAAVTPDPAPTAAPVADSAATATADATMDEPVAAPATETAALDPAAPDAPATETATADPALPATEPAPAAEPAKTEMADAAPAVTQPITETPAATAPATEPAPATEAPATEPAPAEEAPAVQTPEPAPEVMPAAPEEPKPEVKLADATPGQDVPDMPGKKPEGLPDASSEMTAPDAADVEGGGPVFKPAPGQTAKDDGVVIKRGNQAEPAPAETDAAATLPPADTRPIAAYAAKFENADGKPPFAIVLIDDGRADLDRAGLAALPLPVSIALDPMDPAASERAAAYRAAGKEVVMLVTGIAQGAQASDVEVAFQSMAQGLPEAVAALDLPQPAFQNNRVLASAVVPILKAQGRGLLTWDAGLNAADQVARREDLEAAVVFRDLDQAKGDQAGMRRLLDRAVFKAGQEGRVAVVGTADADMLTGLLEWSVEGKAATVAVAPVTAVLKVD